MLILLNILISLLYKKMIIKLYFETSNFIFLTHFDFNIWGLSTSFSNKFFAITQNIILDISSDQSIFLFYNYLEPVICCFYYQWDILWKLLIPTVSIASSFLLSIHSNVF